MLSDPAWAAGAASLPDPNNDTGAGIYLRGTASSGQAVAGSRSAASKVQGTAAACANCHQRSGLGSREGRSFIPPITGRYLFRPLTQVNKDFDLPYVEGMRPDRPPYTDATLARAIREGVDSQDKPLSYLMPRYELGEADMAALVGYLKQLDQRHVPGISATALHFATIITPDADPVKRRGMLEVLQQFFAARNVRQLGAAPRIMGQGKSVYAGTLEMEHRRWELHVWELAGPPSDWQRQLDQFLASQPVLAVVSGLGGSTWAPVHAFCERAAVPCLFPNVEVPVDQQRDFYSLYFTRGVMLEADLMADAILQPEEGGKARTVRQFYRPGDSGAAGAAALAAALKGHGVEVTSQALVPGRTVGEELSSSAAPDALVLWLRPRDMATLGAAPAAGTAVYLSGLLGGLEGAPLPPDWRARAQLAYPFDLPDRRRVRVDFVLGWFRMRKIPIVDLQVQTDTYLACGLLSETLSHMVDALGRDYLVERMQSMLEHRIVTGYYPRLAMATGQRFASKGGYLVHFADGQGSRLLPDQGWKVP
nr:c-type cytochrome [Ramlibacter agri]